MATLLQKFTSTGDKILYHRQAIKDLAVGKNHPIVMHIMPTERCDLRCEFCSVAQRGDLGKIFPDLPLADIVSTVKVFKEMGLKAVIISGGGEPALYGKINELIDYLCLEGLEVGLITNGTHLHLRIKANILDKLSWIRVSANTLDYRDSIPAFHIGYKTTFGMSYIVNPRTTGKTLLKIAHLAREWKASYVRLLPDCNLPSEELEKEHKKLAKAAKELGHPFFHQWKSHGCPPQCHLGRVHPVLYTDRLIYPCDSVVLNSPPDDKRFHQEFSLCQLENAKEFFERSFTQSLINTNMCPHCVFERQNIILQNIIEGGLLPDKPEVISHVNFI